MADEANFIIRLRDKLSGPARKMRGSLTGLKSGVENLDRRASRLTFGERMKSQAGRFIKYAGLAAAAAAGMFAKSTIQTGAAFGEAISAVGAVGLQTREQIGALEEKAKDLGSTTKFTATEAANAMEIMARAGFKNQEILTGVDGVLSAAAASGLGIAEVADHVSSALKGMGLEANEAGRVADVLALASSRTNSSIGSLGESLKNVAATARDLGVPLEDTVAAVALLQDVGLDASVAGSAMNTMMIKMAKPSAEVTAQMKKFGVSFKDAKGNMLPFQDVLANISSAAEQSGGNMDKIAFLADLVGLRGQKAASNLAYLFDQGRVGNLTEELEQAAGSAEKMEKLRMDNLIGDWTLLQSAIDGVKTELFETQDSALRGMVQGFRDWLTESQKAGKFTEWLASAKLGLQIAWQWIKALASGIGDVIGALTGTDDATDGITKLGNAFQTVTDYLVVYREEIATAFKWIGRIGGVVLGAAAALKVLGAAITLVSFLLSITPLGWIVIGITAIVAAVWYFRDEIAAGFTAALEWVGGVIDDFKYIFDNFGTFMVDAGIAIGKALIDGMLGMIVPGPIVQKIKSMGLAVIDAAKGIFGISSPSKEFEWIGKMNMEGLAGGQVANDNMVIDSVASVASQSVTAAERPTPAVPGAASGGTVVNITIENMNFNGAGAEQGKQAGQTLIEAMTAELERAS